MNKRRKVVLLASSYLDAFEDERSGFQTGAKPGSRPLLRGSQLWRDGSYADLERAINLLRLDNRKRYSWFWRLYVICERPQNIAAHKMASAYQGLSFVVEQMPSNVYVPVEIAENGGFMPSVALTARRPRLSSAA